MACIAEREPKLLAAGSDFNSPLDRMLRLNRGDRLPWLASTRRGLRSFQELKRSDEAALLHAIAMRDAANRLIFRFHTKQPRLAKALAECIPIDGLPSELRDVPLERPIVISLMHLGPIYAASTVAMRLLKGRKVYIFHAGGEHGHTVSRYFKDIGGIPVLNARGSLRAVEAGLADGTPSAVMMCFDYLGGQGTQTIPFLGGTLCVPTGLAHLLERTGALMVTAWWDVTRVSPRLRVSGINALDETVAPEERKTEFMSRMYRLLETHVRETPQAWTEWMNCG